MKIVKAIEEGGKYELPVEGTRTLDSSLSNVATSGEKGSDDGTLDLVSDSAVPDVKGSGQGSHQRAIRTQDYPQEEMMTVRCHEERMRDLLYSMDQAIAFHESKLQEERAKHKKELKSAVKKYSSLKELFDHRLEAGIEERTNQLWERYEERIEEKIHFEAVVKVILISFFVPSF